MWKWLSESSDSSQPQTGTREAKIFFWISNTESELEPRFEDTLPKSFPLTLLWGKWNNLLTLAKCFPVYRMGPPRSSQPWLGHLSLLWGVNKDNNARPGFRDFDQLLRVVASIHSLFKAPQGIPGCNWAWLLPGPWDPQRQSVFFFFNQENTRRFLAKKNVLNRNLQQCL